MRKSKGRSGLKYSIASSIMLVGVLYNGDPSITADKYSGADKIASRMIYKKITDNLEDMGSLGFKSGKVFVNVYGKKTICHYIGTTYSGREECIVIENRDENDFSIVKSPIEPGTIVRKIPYSVVLNDPDSLEKMLLAKPREFNDYALCDETLSSRFGEDKIDATICLKEGIDRNETYHPGKYGDFRCNFYRGGLDETDADQEPFISSKMRIHARKASENVSYNAQIEDFSTGVNEEGMYNTPLPGMYGFRCLRVGEEHISGTLFVFDKKR